MKLFRKKQRRMLTKSYQPEGIRFAYTDEPVPVFPLNSNDSEILSKLLFQGDLWFSLDNLWAEGLLKQASDGTWIVPYAIYDQLSGDEDSDLFHVLDIPVPEPLEMELNSYSHVGDERFRIAVEANHPDYGPLREGDPYRNGRVFVMDDGHIAALTADQARVFDLAQGNDVNWDSLEDRMGYLAAVKDAAEKVNAKIDNYLSSEEYAFRTEATLDMRMDSPEEITLIPEVEGMKSYGIGSGEELLTGDTGPVITKAESGYRRKRLVLDKHLSGRLAELPEGGKVKGVEVPRLLTSPEQIIPDGFDLSLFSERVKGIKTKVYNSRPYIHVAKTMGGWFEGVPDVQLEDWSPVGSSDKESGESDSSDECRAPEGLSPETYRELVKRSKESGEEFVLHGNAWIRIDSETGEKFDRVLNTLTKQENGTIKIPAGAVLDIYENLELLEFVDKQSLPEDVQLLPDDLPDIDPPENFNGELYPYQLKGFRWLSRLSSRLMGGLLADEMGLGKTVQIIAHLMNIKESGEKGPHLVVLPKTLMENWTKEIREFSNGKLSVFIYNGWQVKGIPDSCLNEFDIVLTTYDTLRRNQARLAKIDWNMVVCDEAQYAKNPTTQRTCAVKALKSRHRAALTGTPVENGLIEFWCIMDFVQPGVLGSWADFRKLYERPIVENGEGIREEKIQELLAKINDHYLRRLKSKTLDLPPKKINYTYVPLSETQKSIYRDIAHAGRTGGQGAALGAIQKLIMLCAHPSAVFQVEHISLKTDMAECPKLQATLDIISEVQAVSEKVIIFSDFKRVQRILRWSVQEKFGIWPDIINGEITKNRQRIIDIFSDKPGFNVIILGHQVAGVGLNITAANHVIHYTRPWNPARENQATDRVHRIRQTKPVHVYYPLVKETGFVTVEERLDELIRSKADLARDVLRPSAELKINPEELLECLDVQD